MRNVLQSAPTVVVTDRKLALMNALNSVFPATKRILCWFHIRQNPNSKQSVENSVFWEEMIVDCVRSLTKEGFENKLLALFNKWTEKQIMKSVIDYFIEGWAPYQEFFASYHINKYTHFGQITTTRNESAHHALKGFDKIHKLDLHGILFCIDQHCNHQYANFKQELTREKISIPKSFLLNPDVAMLFGSVIKKISTHALKEVLEPSKKC
ncbi:hypothetical protein RCL1_007645 [Eukaryota sp. TZLM3-RCL]